MPSPSLPRQAFYAKRIHDFNDAQRLATNASGTQLGGFPETAPFVGIADAGVGPEGSGPIGWQTFQPEAQLWLYKYYGDLSTLHESFNATHAFVRMLAAAGPVEHGLGDWMPVDATSTAFTGLGFQRMAFLAFANISRLVGAPDLASMYAAKAGAIATELNALFFDAQVLSCDLHISRDLPRAASSTRASSRTERHLPHQGCRPGAVVSR